MTSVGCLRVRIDASNLFVGGGVQVGASFLTELSSDYDNLANEFAWLREPGFVFEASSIVLANSKLSARPSWVTVIDRPGIRGLMERPNPSDLRFVVFGPSYVPSRSTIKMCGFADIESLVSSAPKPSARAVVRGRISRALFRREGHLIVEAPTVRAELVSRWGIAAEAIRVVPNVVNAIFTCPADWAPLDVRTPEGVPVLGYVARAYPHKNHNFLGELGEELDALGSSVKFLLTLTETEWIELSDNTRRHSINVGPVAVPQLPAFYASCNAVVFPSLNEAFSATPLETMATRRPLFASDRRFVRDVAGDAATYFDPLDPRQAADVISRGLKDKGRLEDGIRSGSELVDAWPTAAGRAHSYLDAIDLALKGVAR